MLAITYRTSDTSMHSLETSREKRQKRNQRVWLAPGDVYVPWPCLHESCACRERRFHSLWTYFVASHDEHILSLAIDSSKDFNTTLANLNGCQHFCRPSLHENVTVRPVCKERANFSTLRYLLLEWSDLPVIRMKFVLLQGDFSEIQAVNNSLFHTALILALQALFWLSVKYWITFTALFIAFRLTLT